MADKKKFNTYRDILCPLRLYGRSGGCTHPNLRHARLTVPVSVFPSPLLPGDPYIYAPNLPAPPSKPAHPLRPRLRHPLRPQQLSELVAVRVLLHLAASPRQAGHHERRLPAARGARRRREHADGDPQRAAPPERAQAVLPPGRLQLPLPPPRPPRRGPGPPPLPPPAPRPRDRRPLRARREPAPRRRAPRARRRPRDRLPRAPPARRLPARLRVLQAGARARGHPGDVHAAVGGGGGVHGREPGVPAQDPGAVGAGPGDLLPPRGAQLAAQPVHGGGPRRGGGRHVRRHRPGARQDGRPGARHRGGGRQLQPLQPDAVALRHDRQPLRAPRERRQLQPRRHGVQRRAHLHRPRQAAAPGAPEHVRAGGEHGEHHAQLVLGQQPLHAHVQLPLPDGRRGGAPDEPRRRGPAARQVPAGAHGAHAPGRRRPRLPLRVPGGGRVGSCRRGAVQGPDGRRRRGAQDQHHHAGPAGPAHVGADPLPGVPRGPPRVRPPLAPAIPPGLQDGVRALLHPRGGARGAGHHRGQPGAQRLAHGAVADDAVPVGEHLQQLAVVRARVHGGAGAGAAGPPRVADRVRVRVQVQQRRVEGAAGRRPRGGEGGEPVGGGDPQVPRRGAQGRERRHGGGGGVFVMRVVRARLLCVLCGGEWNVYRVKVYVD